MVETRGRKRIQIENIDAEEIIKKTVKSMGARSGGIYLPSSWIGREIVIALPKRDKDLRFVEYALSQGMRFLEESKKLKSIEENPLLLDSMLHTMELLSNLDDDYIIPDDVLEKIHDILQQLDHALDLESSEK